MLWVLDNNVIVFRQGYGTVVGLKQKALAERPWHIRVDLLADIADMGGNEANLRISESLCGSPVQVLRKSSA